MLHLRMHINIESGKTMGLVEKVVANPQQGKSQVIYNYPLLVRTFEGKDITKLTKPNIKNIEGMFNIFSKTPKDL